MLSTSSSIEEHEKLVVEEGRFPVRIDPGNPFMVSEEFHFLSVEKKPSDTSFVENKDILKSTSFIDAFMNRQLETTTLRLERTPGNTQMINNLGISYLNKGDYDSAIKYFQEALQIDKNSFASIANQAKAYLLKGDIDKALDLYMQMEKGRPADTKILMNIGTLLLRKKDMTGAQDYFKKTLKIDDKNVAALSNMGTVLLLERHINKAIHYYRRALEVQGNSAGTLNNIGVCFAFRKSYQKAIKYFLAARALNKVDVAALLNLAVAYQAKGLHEGAIKILEDRLESGNEDKQVREALAWSYFATRDYQNASKQLGAVLRLVGSGESNRESRASAYNNMAVISQRMGDYGKAEQYYHLSLENRPSTLIPFYNAIFLYFMEDKNDIAKQIIDEALVKFPDDPYINEFLGRYYFEIGDYAKSSEVLANVIAVEPAVVDSYATLAVIEMEVNKDPARAYDILTKGLVHHPDELVLLNNLAYSYLMKDEIDKARQIIDRVKAQDDIFITATRGLLLIKEGNIQEGQRLYNQARSRATHQYTANLISQKKYLETGRYYLKQGNTNEAIRLFKKAVPIKARYNYYRNEAKEILETLK
jgi:tetratricopeptide (TPR) repeat protein